MTALLIVALILCSLVAVADLLVILVMAITGLEEGELGLFGLAILNFGPILSAIVAISLSL